jgi:hypothetical protein
MLKISNLMFLCLVYLMSCQSAIQQEGSAILVRGGKVFSDMKWEQRDFYIYQDKQCFRTREE